MCIFLKWDLLVELSMKRGESSIATVITSLYDVLQSSKGFSFLSNTYIVLWPKSLNIAFCSTIVHEQ